MSFQAVRPENPKERGPKLSYKTAGPAVCLHKLNVAEATRNRGQ